MSDDMVLKPIFDRRRCRQIADGHTVVMHCHHSATLITRLAIDCAMLDGKKLIAQCAEDVFYKVLVGYCRRHDITGLRERVKVAERYFAEAGLGKLVVQCAGHTTGEVVLEHSHVDEGWKKKWGVSSHPVNHLGRGYISAMFSVIFDRPTRTYEAIEQQSIACGADHSFITVTDAVNL
jgi:hypothetical protein